MPSVISAPSAKFPATPAAKAQPSSFSASPPPGNSLKICIVKIVAAVSSASPMPICTLRRGQRETIPAPSHDPTTDAAIIATSVVMSTSTTRMNRKASASVGAQWPTFNVPGIFSSGTIFQNLNTDVVGANDPMPSVSKKLVTKPTTYSLMVGQPSAPNFPHAAALQ